jgi:copper chaperone CopZ
MSNAEQGMSNDEISIASESYFGVRNSLFDIRHSIFLPADARFEDSPMQRHGSFSAALLLALVVGLVDTASGKEDDAIDKLRTHILVKDMHCADCAKKVARKLYAVKGVKGVRAVVKTNTATVTPEKGKQPSPLAMWEAVEEAGFIPVRLAGPAGEFKEKPKE